MGFSGEEIEGFVRAFIHKERRDRWRTLLRSAKGRRKLVHTFDHGLDFDPRWAERVEPMPAATDLARRLRKAGAGEEVYLLSSDWELDGQTLGLEEALGRVIGSGFGTYVVCVPDRLAYFESEEVGERYLLRRPPS